MAPTPYNAPCWHLTRRPREICSPANIRPSLPQTTVLSRTVWSKGYKHEEISFKALHNASVRSRVPVPQGNIGFPLQVVSDSQINSVVELPPPPSHVHPPHKDDGSPPPRQGWI